MILNFHRMDNVTGNTDVERLIELALSEGVSEHAIFERAARVWAHYYCDIDKAFNKYLFTEELPWWVKHYIRCHG